MTSEEQFRRTVQDYLNWVGSRWLAEGEEYELKAREQDQYHAFCDFIGQFGGDFSITIQLSCDHVTVEDILKTSGRFRVLENFTDE